MLKFNDRTLQPQQLNKTDIREYHSTVDVTVRSHSDDNATT